jgi:hypothetical protein
MLLCGLLFNARCFDPFALPSSELIHLIVQRASLLFVLPLNLSPIQYKVSLMMIGAKISHGCIQSSQTCFFCDVSGLVVHHTKKKSISQTLNKGCYKIFKKCDGIGNNLENTWELTTTFGNITWNTLRTI